MFLSKPSWQMGTGVPSDSWRHVPDVAASSSPHDGYLMYMNNGLYSVAGTSAASPAWAGIMGLVNQQNGGSQGNANSMLYALAQLQGSGGAAVFHDIVSGANSVPGAAGFSAGAGYDQATGLGSPDAFQLVQHWKDANAALMFAAMSNSNLAVTQGAGTSTTIRTSVNKLFNASVSLSVWGLPAGLQAVWYPPFISAPGAGTSSVTFSAGTLVAPGTYSLQVSASGGNITQTIPITITVAKKTGP
jgi:subtilase family serine protease